VKINNIYLVVSTVFLIFLQSCDNGWEYDIPGCLDINAINFDPSADSDNGSCIFEVDESIDEDDSSTDQDDILYDCEYADDDEQCFNLGCSCYWLSNQCYDSQEQGLVYYDIDATSYDDWIYFSFLLGTIIEVSEPENSLEWDIAFKRNHMKTNGGLSGIGDVCAIVDSDNTWSNINFNECIELPNLECQTDEMIEGNLFTQQGCYNPTDGIHLFESCIKNPALDQWGVFGDNYTFYPSNYQLFIKDINGIYIKFWPISYEDINGERGIIRMRYQYFN